MRNFGAALLGFALVAAFIPVPVHAQSVDETIEFIESFYQSQRASGKVELSVDQYGGVVLDCTPDCDYSLTAFSLSDVEIVLDGDRLRFNCRNERRCVRSRYRATGNESQFTMALIFYLGEEAALRSFNAFSHLQTSLRGSQPF